MIGLIPWPYRIGIAAALVGILCVSSYVFGRKHVRGQLDALRQGYEVAAAQAAGREAERVRQWSNAITVAGEKYAERAKIADSSFDASFDRLRNAYSSSARVRIPSSLTRECPQFDIGTKAELFREAEALAAAIRDASRDRAGLESAADSWPR